MGGRVSYWRSVVRWVRSRPYVFAVARFLGWCVFWWFVLGAIVFSIGVIIFLEVRWTS
jgi:predicted membrane channel-forming protein YqfA (hemolysin III family)